MSETLDVKDDQRTASQMLSEARIALGLSQEEVAQELFLIPSYIRDIDSNKIDNIDKQAFVRGYLRSYAKLVNLDGDDMVNRYEKTQGAKPQKIEIRAVTQESVGSTNFTGPVIQTAIIGLIGFVAVVSLVWFLVSSDEEEIVATTPTSSSSSITNSVTDTPVISASSTTDNPTADDVQSPLIADPIGEAQTDEALSELDDSVGQTQGSLSSAAADISSTASEVEQEVQEFAETVSERGETVIEDQIPAQIDQASEVVQQQSAQTLSETPSVLDGKEISVSRNDGVITVEAGGSDQLSFVFSDECWIEIEDAEGHAIYGDLNREGDELVVSGVAPFEVLFGKAPAVTMQFNGQPFDLAPHTTSVDTAKVKVGN